MSPRLSLKYRIALTIFALEAVMMGLVLWQTLSQSFESSREQMVANEEVTLSLLSNLARLALVTEEYADLQPYIERTQRDPHVVQILLADGNNRIVAGSAPGIVGSPLPVLVTRANQYWRTLTITNAAGNLGILAIKFSSTALIQANRKALDLGITIAVGGMTIIAVVGVLMGFLLTQRLQRLTEAAQQIATGDLSVRTGQTGRDEIANLGQALDRMAAEIEKDMADLHESEQRFALAVQATTDGIWDLNVLTGHIYLSPRCKEMCGFSPGEVDDNFLTWRELIHPDDLGQVLEMWAGHSIGDKETFSLDYRMRTKQGNYIWVRSQGITSRNDKGQVVRLTGSLTDITEVRMQAAALEHQALHDALTDLPNRSLFFDRLQQAILIADRDKRSLAVLMMDLDRFKDINDTLGHHIGDLLLQRVGKRLRSVLRDSDTVARLGGDEFAVLLSITNHLQASNVAAKIVETLETPFLMEGQQLHAGVSIGIALYPDHGNRSDVLIRRADVAMYVAKQANSGFAIYDAEQDRHSLSRLNLVSELRHALRQNELLLHYQPKVSMKTGTVSNVEALVRWQHPKHGLLQPDHFIPLAEDTGLVKPLTFWVVNAALGQAKDWQQNGAEIGISVNLSARTVQDPAFVGLVEQLLEKWSLPAALLELELTESAIMTDPERAMEILTRLDTMGIRLAIDDFGTGYTSLGSLKQLPVDELKLDKSFVMDMEEDENDAVIVRSTIDLAHNLGLSVVAEGVKNRGIWDLLCMLDCDAAQGYYLTKPLPPKELQRWLYTSPWGLAKESNIVSIKPKRGK